MRAPIADPLWLLHRQWQMGELEANDAGSPIAVTLERSERPLSGYRPATATAPGRPLAARLGYDPAVVEALADRAVESFAGVGNRFSLRRLHPGKRVVDVGSGAASTASSPPPRWARPEEWSGVDMTREMLEKAIETAAALGAAHVAFREGVAEAFPVEDGWADAVISNGVINLCADKQAVFAEIRRVLRPGGWLQFADIANGRPVPPEALRDIDLWTG